jgi:hypothetical protein
MNTVGGSVVWNLDVDNKKLAAGLTQADRDIKSFSDKGSKNFQSFARSQADSIRTFSLAIAGAQVAMGLFLKSSIDASIKMENSLTGLATVARAFNQDQEATTAAAKSLAQDGLMSVADAASGLKNLLATGFSLPEATNLMKAFKDSAAFNRQGMLGFGEAIVGATQGIKNQNSIMVDNVGISKNLSIILKEQGLSVNDLQNVTSDASVRQKLYNGLLKEGAIFSGDSTRATQTLGGQQAQLATNMFNLKAQIGDVLRIGYTPLLTKINEYISTNPKLITSIVVATAAGLGLVAAVLALRFAFITLWASLGPITIALALVGALVGIVMFKAMQKMQDQMGATSKNFTAGATEIGNAATTNLGENGKAAKAAKDLKEKLADIDKQIETSKKTFKEQLAEMVRDSQKKVSDLRASLDKENKDFEKSEADKLADFKKTQYEMGITYKRTIADILKSTDRENQDFDAGQKENLATFEDSKNKMVTSHERKVADISSQIDKEVAKGVKGDQDKLASLHQSLAEENADYEQNFADLKRKYEEDTAKSSLEHTRKLDDLQARLTQENEDNEREMQARAAQYEADTAKAKEQHAAKALDLQQQLDSELAFEQKHADDVLSVKDFQFRDELQKLKDTHAEQLVSYDEQKKKAIQSAKDTATGIGTELGALPGIIKNGGLGTALTDIGKDLGEDMGKQFMKALGDSIKELPGDAARGVTNWFNRVGSSIRDALKTPFYSTDEGRWIMPSDPDYAKFSKRADGGPVSPGVPYKVGERGEEIFVPNVAGKIIPHEEVSTMGKQISIVNNIDAHYDFDIQAVSRGMAYQAAVI